jgi:transcriptional regulator with XRE-family HTH domain
LAKREPLAPEYVRYVRRQRHETQVQFARRLGVGPVTVARWETGQRRCGGGYAEIVRRLAPADAAPAGPEGSAVSALAQLARALFHGSTATAVSALLEDEGLSTADLDALSRLIEAKKKNRRKTRKEKRWPGRSPSR